MNKCVILVDNSNVFIGGQQLAAKQAGENGGGNDHATGREKDHSWRINFDGLLAALAKGREVYAAIMVGSATELRPEVWDAARACGFEVIVHERNGPSEKCVDTELVVRGTEIVTTAPEAMTLVIASGDLDFLPLVECAHAHGWDVEMCAFTDSYRGSGDLAQSVERVRPLDDLFEKIGFRE